MSLSRRKALCMTKGSGDNAVTHYNAAIAVAAKEQSVAVLIAKSDPNTGKVKIVPRSPRIVHRPDLCGKFCDTHEQAGEGKYIHLDAYPGGDPSSRVVRGAQHVNPYLKNDGVGATIVNVFRNNIGKPILAKLKAVVSHTRERGDHLLWEGRRDPDGCVAASDWMTEEQIWKLACKSNSGLLGMLRKSKSARRGVETRKSAKGKFLIDLNVLRRATRTVDAATGDVKHTGGYTPYAAPLEQCGYAIDRRYLTFGVDANGVELAQYYYRMVIGRSSPYPLPKKSWATLGTDSSTAYLNKRSQKIAQRAA